jgi:IS30 family transposase
MYLGMRVRDGFFALVRQGVSISEACRVSGLWSSTVRHWVRKMGSGEMSKGNREGPAGAPFPDGAPGSGRLSLPERAVIMVRLRHGWSYGAIGRELGLDRSVIWREARRNCCDDGTYRSDVAELKAGQNAAGPRNTNSPMNPLPAWWSPRWTRLVPATVLAGPGRGFPGR